MNQLLALDSRSRDDLVGDHLFHPVRGPEFIRSADGITVVVDELRQDLPKS